MHAERDDATRWKHKYYNSLDEIERKERGWEEAQQTLYTGLGRLALAAYGTEPKLDRMLDGLREALRARRDLRRIDSMIGKIQETASLHQSHVKKRTEDPGLFALQVIEAVPFPRPLNRQARRLKKRVAGHEIPLADAGKELATLIGAALRAPGADADTEHPESSGEPRPRNPLRRLLGGRATENPPQAPDPYDVLGRLLARLELPAPLATPLATLRKRLEDAIPPGTDEQLLDEIAALISRATAAPRAAPDRGDTVSEGDGTASESGPLPGPLREVLLGLIEQIDPPPESQERLEALKTRVSGRLDVSDFAGVLACVAGMIGELRAELRGERLGVQLFLAGLSERLGDLDRALATSREDHGASLEGSRALQTGVADEVDGLRESVAQAADIDSLRHLVERRLVTISSHVQHHLDGEMQRNSTANERIDRLEGELRETRAASEELRRRVDEAQERASRDGLTGALNRAAFDERLTAEHARARRHANSLSLLFWDLDHFKSINDTWGHQAGDRVLEHVTELLRKDLRESDCLARYGGEELVILLPETPLDGALKVAEKLRRLVADTHFHYQSDRVPVTISCGAAELHPDESAAELVKRADAALYQAKEAGRNRCRAAA